MRYFCRTCIAAKAVHDNDTTYWEHVVRMHLVVNDG